MLYFVPTPIWNKEDITLRALRLLNEINILICEDTRTAKKLLSMYDISAVWKEFFSITSFTSQGKLDFYAYYPRMDVNSIEELPFSVSLDQSVPAGETTMSAYEASDFLWTRTLGITRMESVPLVFKHKMSKIIVNLQKGIDYEGDLPSDAILLIHNTIPDALIDLSTGDVVKSPRSVTQTIIAQKEADGVYSAIIVPQMLTNRVPLFELICQDVSYLVESKFNFKSGICHSVNFALSDNPERVKISIGGEIDGWN